MRLLRCGRRHPGKLGLRAVGFAAAGHEGILVLTPAAGEVCAQNRQGGSGGNSEILVEIPLVEPAMVNQRIRNKKDDRLPRTAPRQVENLKKVHSAAALCHWPGPRTATVSRPRQKALLKV